MPHIRETQVQYLGFGMYMNMLSELADVRLSLYRSRLGKPACGLSIASYASGRHLRGGLAVRFERAQA